MDARGIDGAVAVKRDAVPPGETGARRAECFRVSFRSGQWRAVFPSRLLRDLRLRVRHRRPSREYLPLIFAFAW